jgi:hypothetical protein
VRTKAKKFGLEIGDTLNALGFLLGDKKAGPFKLEVEWLKTERTDK